MTFNKAYRRYPHGTRIKYIGNKIFDPVCIQYGFEEMNWCHMPVSDGDVGIVEGFIFNKDNINDAVGIEVLFEVPYEYWNVYRFETVNLYFGEDIFVRTF